jgi:two-component system nitrogen regulation response regulator NtrX
MAARWNASMTPQGVTTAAEILVVDDDAILRDLVADWLLGAGYRVRKAPDCHAALEAIQERVPALIVSDMYMPGACGPAAIDEFKRHAPQAPLIAVSGYFKSGSGVSSDQALAAGAARALAKPVRRAHLLDAVKELIGPPG